MFDVGVSWNYTQNDVKFYSLVILDIRDDGFVEAYKIPRIDKVSKNMKKYLMIIWIFPERDIYFRKKSRNQRRKMRY